ncbi:MAG TPA: hypothetical protein VJ652_16500 [Noviherbaspirillum sp.]|nr:hypothetical protein [Noviherbaspirillum sp.]
MSEQNYAGHTLAEIKAAAEATNDIIRSHGWDGTVEMGDHMGKDESFMKLASPVTMLALAARIEELERELHRVTTEPPTGVAPCARLCEHVALKSQHEADKRRIADLAQDHAAALRLVAEVRHACGDDGKRMPDELVQYVGELTRDAARYRQLRRGQCWSVIDGIGKSLRADELDAAIDTMQPPAEWGGAQNGPNTPENPVVTGNGAVTNWPHPDGFAGGLTEAAR